MNKRKLKKKPFIILGVVLFVLVLLITQTVKTINYHKTYDYKLGKIGYSEKEIKDIKKLEDKTINIILSMNYNKDITKFINEKYFIEDNLKEYLRYSKESDKSNKDIVAIINVGANNDWYTHTKKTDLAKGNLILTNKFNYLDSTYNSNNMKKISSTYSYGNSQMLTDETFNAFLKMFDKAKEEGLTLIINSSFRSYENQDEIYNEFKDSKGEDYADSIAARPGYSEHQTGMAIDIQTYGSTGATFEEFDEFKWLKDNAHKYGFILRYPKDKEYLTGYSYESWHYRYVGVEVATYIYKNNITFDEYYAYYLR